MTIITRGYLIKNMAKTKLQVSLQKMISSRKKAKKSNSKPITTKETKSTSTPNPIIFKWVDSTLSKLPFSTGLRVLTVGDGDLSFSYSLASLGVDVIPSVYETKDEFIDKYVDNFYDKLTREFNTETVFDFDVTKKINKSPEEWDILVWNFPHTGQGIKNQEHNVFSQQKLLSKFFSILNNLMTKRNGDQVVTPLVVKNVQDDLPIVNNNVIETKSKLIYITIWCGEPYDSWNVKKIASKNNFKCLFSFPFTPDLYPFYRHVKTKGSKSLFSKPARTFVFY